METRRGMAKVEIDIHRMIEIVKRNKKIEKVIAGKEVAKEVIKIKRKNIRKATRAPTRKTRGETVTPSLIPTSPKVNQIEK